MVEKNQNSKSKKSSKNGSAKSHAKKHKSSSTQRGQSLKKTEAQAIWSEYSKNSENELKRTFNKQKKEATEKLDRIHAKKEGRVSPKEYARLNKMKRIGWKAYRKTHVTKAERDEKTFDLNIVTPNKAETKVYDSKTKSRTKLVKWKDDPSKMDYPNVDTPKVSKQEMAQKREKGKRHIEVADARVELKKPKNLFTQPFIRVINNTLSKYNASNYVSKVDNIIDKQRTNFDWNDSIIRGQRKIYNENVLLKKKESYTKEIESDLKKIQAMQDKIDSVKTTYKVPKYYWNKKGEKVQNPNWFEGAVKDYSPKSKNMKYRARLIKELNQLKYGDAKAQGHLELISIGKKPMLPTKQYAELKKKAEGLYYRHAYINELISRQEMNLKGMHSALGTALKKQRKTSTMKPIRPDRQYFSNDAQYNDAVQRFEKIQKQWGESEELTAKQRVQRALDLTTYIESDIKTLESQLYREKNKLKKKGLSEEQILESPKIKKLMKRFEDTYDKQVQALSLTQSSENIESELNNAVMSLNFMYRLFEDNHLVKKRYDNMKQKLNQLEEEKKWEREWQKTDKAELPSDILDMEELLNKDNMSSKQKRNLARLIELSEAKTSKGTSSISEIKYAMQGIKKDPKVLKWYDIYHTYLKPEYKKMSKAQREVKRKQERSIDRKIGKYAEELGLLEAKLESGKSLSKTEENRFNLLTEKIDTLKLQKKTPNVESLIKDINTPASKWVSPSERKVLPKDTTEQKQTIKKQKELRQKLFSAKSKGELRTELENLSFTELKNIAQPMYDNPTGKEVYVNTRTKEGLITGTINYVTKKTLDKYRGKDKLTDTQKERLQGFGLSDLDISNLQKSVPKDEKWIQSQEKLVKQLNAEINKLQKVVKEKEPIKTEKKEVSNRVRLLKKIVKQMNPDKFYHTSNDPDFLKGILEANLAQLEAQQEIAYIRSGKKNILPKDEFKRLSMKAQGLEPNMTQLVRDKMKEGVPTKAVELDIEEIPIEKEEPIKKEKPNVNTDWNLRQEMYPKLKGKYKKYYESEHKLPVNKNWEKTEDYQKWSMYERMKNYGYNPNIWHTIQKQSLAEVKADYDKYFKGRIRNKESRQYHIEYETKELYRKDLDKQTEIYKDNPTPLNYVKLKKIATDFMLYEKKGDKQKAETMVEDWISQNEIPDEEINHGKPAFPMRPKPEEIEYAEQTGLNPKWRGSYSKKYQNWLKQRTKNKSMKDDPEKYKKLRKEVVMGLLDIEDWMDIAVQQDNKPEINRLAIMRNEDIARYEELGGKTLDADMLQYAIEKPITIDKQPIKVEEKPKNSRKINYLMDEHNTKVGSLPYTKRTIEYETSFNPSDMNIPVNPRKWVELDNAERELVKQFEKETGKTAFQQPNDYMYGNMASEQKREKKGYIQWRIMKEIEKNPNLINQITPNVLEILTKGQLEQLARERHLDTKGKKKAIINRIFNYEPEDYSNTIKEIRKKQAEEKQPKKSQEEIMKEIDDRIKADIAEKEKAQGTWREAGLQPYGKKHELYNSLVKQNMIDLNSGKIKESDKRIQGLINSFDEETVSWNNLKKYYDVISKMYKTEYKQNISEKGKPTRQQIENLANRRLEMEILKKILNSEDKTAYETFGDKLKNFIPDFKSPEKEKSPYIKDMVKTYTNRFLKEYNKEFMGKQLMLIENAKKYPTPKNLKAVDNYIRDVKELLKKHPNVEMSDKWEENWREFNGIPKAPTKDYKSLARTYFDEAIIKPNSNELRAYQLKEIVKLAFGKTPKTKKEAEEIIKDTFLKGASKKVEGTTSYKFDKALEKAGKASELVEVLTPDGKVWNWRNGTGLFSEKLSPVTEGMEVKTKSDLLRQGELIVIGVHRPERRGQGTYYESDKPYGVAIPIGDVDLSLLPIHKGLAKEYYDETGYIAKFGRRNEETEEFKRWKNKRLKEQKEEMEKTPSGPSTKPTLEAPKEFKLGQKIYYRWTNNNRQYEAIATVVKLNQESVKLQIEAPLGETDADYVGSSWSHRFDKQTKGNGMFVPTPDKLKEAEQFKSNLIPIEIDNTEYKDRREYASLGLKWDRDNKSWIGNVTEETYKRIQDKQKELKFSLSKKSKMQETAKVAIEGHEAKIERKTEQTENKIEKLKSEIKALEKRDQYYRDTMTGEPIKTDHHSAKKHRNAHENWDNVTRRLIEARKELAKAEGRLENLEEIGERHEKGKITPMKGLINANEKTSRKSGEKQKENLKIIDRENNKDMLSHIWKNAKFKVHFGENVNEISGNYAMRNFYANKIQSVKMDKDGNGYYEFKDPEVEGMSRVEFKLPTDKLKIPKRNYPKINQEYEKKFQKSLRDYAEKKFGVKGMFTIAHPNQNTEFWSVFQSSVNENIADMNNDKQSKSMARDKVKNRIDSLYKIYQNKVKAGELESPEEKKKITDKLKEVMEKVLRVPAKPYSWEEKRNKPKTIAMLSEYTEDELNQLTKAQLRAIAKKIDANISGSKRDIIDSIHEKSDENYALSREANSFMHEDTQYNRFDNKILPKILGIEYSDIDDAMATDNTNYVENTIVNHWNKLEDNYNKKVEQTEDKNEKKILDLEFDTEWMKADILRDWIDLEVKRVNESNREYYESDKKEFEESAKRKLEQIKRNERRIKELQKKLGKKPKKSQPVELDIEEIPVEKKQPIKKNKNKKIKFKDVSKDVRDIIDWFRINNDKDRYALDIYQDKSYKLYEDSLTESDIAELKREKENIEKKGETTKETKRKQDLQKLLNTFKKEHKKDFLNEESFNKAIDQIKNRSKNKLDIEEAKLITLYNARAEIDSDFERRNKEKFNQNTMREFFDTWKNLRNMSRIHNLKQDDFLKETRNKMDRVKSDKEILELTKSLKEKINDKAEPILKSKKKRAKELQKKANELADKIEPYGKKVKMGRAKQDINNRVSYLRRLTQDLEENIKTGVRGSIKSYEETITNAENDLSILKKTDGYALGQIFRKYNYYLGKFYDDKKENIEKKAKHVKKWGKIFGQLEEQIKTEKQRFKINSKAIPLDRETEYFLGVPSNYSRNWYNDFNDAEKEIYEETENWRSNISDYSPQELEKREIPMKHRLKKLQDTLDFYKKENDRIEKNREKGIIGTWNRRKPKPLTENQKRNLARLRRIKKLYDEDELYKMRDDTLDKMRKEAKKVNYGEYDDSKKRDFHSMRPYHLINKLYDKETELLDRYIKNIRHYYE